MLVVPDGNDHGQDALGDPASARRIGIPAGVQIRYSRSPQNQPEWEAQCP
jgi:hypothetical protein